MARWSSPDERATPTQALWGEYAMAGVKVTLRVSETDLTLNMYGHTTATHDLHLTIGADQPDAKRVTLGLPGAVTAAFALQRGEDHYCVLHLRKRRYRSLGSNAIEDVERVFVVGVPEGACWVCEEHRWQPWRATTAVECPEQIAAYLVLRARYGPPAGAERPVLHRPWVLPGLTDLRDLGCLIGGILLAVSLAVLPITLVTHLGRWRSARQEYREALARYEAGEAQWRALTTAYSELPLPRMEARPDA